jgi:hypothetical protein
MANVAKILGQVRNNGTETLVQLDDAKQTKVWRPTSSLSGGSSSSSSSSGSSSALAEYLDRANSQGRFENLSGDARAEAQKTYENEKNIKDLYSSLPSAEKEAQKLEDERQARLQQFVDPVLEQQKAVIAALTGRTNIEDYYNTLKEERGVNAQEDQIKALGTETSSVLELLRQLPQSVTDRTQGTFTTQAQRQAIEGKERTPLSDSLTSLSNLLTGARTGLSDTNNDIMTALGVRQTQDTRDMEPLQTGLTFAGENLDRARQDEASRLTSLLSGFTSDQQSALSKISSLITNQNQNDQELEARLANDKNQIFTAAQSAVDRAAQATENQKTREATVQENTVAFDREKELKKLQNALDTQLAQIKASTNSNASSDDILAWVQEILDGNATLSDVPAGDNLKSAVNTALNAARSSQTGTDPLSSDSGGNVFTNAWDWITGLWPGNNKQSSTSLNS